MSNPTTHVSVFDGAAPGWSVTGPERYAGGLWLEEGTVNLVSNPSFEAGTTGWSASGSTLAQSALHPASGAKSMEVTATGANAGASTSITLDATSYALSGTIYNATAAARNAALRYAGADGVTFPVSSGQQQRVSRIVTGFGGSTFFVPRIIDSVAGELFYFDALQIEQKAYVTSYTDSTRAASSASISPAGILDPATGAIAFRITPTIETGVEEIWGEVGAKGSGTDHVRWGRDSSKHPFVEWSSNDAAYQRLTASETWNALATKMLYLGWNGTTASLQVENGTLQTHTRDAISDSWGAGDLKLQATAGGVVYRNFAAFDRTLTALEISRLAATYSWTRDTITGKSRIRQQFQLRPY